MYIWEQPDWPYFYWDESTLQSRMNAVRLLQGRLLGRTEAAPAQTDLEVEMDALIQNAIRTSEIEGDHLDAGSVRSSAARQLGLERAEVSGSSMPGLCSMNGKSRRSTGCWTLLVKSSSWVSMHVNISHWLKSVKRPRRETLRNFWRRAVSVNCQAAGAAPGIQSQTRPLCASSGVFPRQLRKPQN